MRKRVFSLLVAGLLALSLVGPVQAANWANPDLLVSVGDVKKNVSKADWVIVDCRKLEEYVKGHIPGAISLGKNCKSALRDGTSRVFSDVSHYDKILSKAGIGGNTHVVFYGEVKSKSMDDSSVAFWILEYLGHNKTHVMNGGLEEWTKAGNKLDAQPTIKNPAVFKSKVVKSRYASTAEVLEIAKGKKKGVQVIDARTKKEFEGDDIRAIRGGRIPHVTLNVSHMDTYDKVKDHKTGKDTTTGNLSPATVAKFYEKLDKNTRTIAYCQTGSRSTLTYLELRLLGFKEPANWDDSWIVWANSLHKGYPVEDEQWIDLSRIKELEDTVKKLKEKLEAPEKK